MQATYSAYSPYGPKMLRFICESESKPNRELFIEYGTEYATNDRVPC